MEALAARPRKPPLTQASPARGEGRGDEASFESISDFFGVVDRMAGDDVVAERVDAGFPFLWKRRGRWVPAFAGMAVGEGVGGGMIPAMNWWEKRAGRRSRKQRERALIEVEGRQFTVRRFLDRAVFAWMPIVIAIVAIVVVIIWQTQ